MSLIIAQPKQERELRRLRDALIDGATQRYRRVDRHAYHFARSKLRADPVFTLILQQGLLGEARDILDLGCGIGILESWLRSARDQYSAGQWPAEWPAPPSPRHIHGIDHDPRDLGCALAAAGELAEFRCADARVAPFGNPDTVVILDVLHYMGYAQQEEVLEHVRAAIDPRGLLLMRIGDASGGLRFAISEWIDRAVLIARRGIFLPLHCRPAAQWRELLLRVGFSCERIIPMSAGTPFANQLFLARPSS
jgi:SAM-dependent methyltransferase